MSAHDGDFYAWTQQQAALLKAGWWAKLDIEHLIGEIETVDQSVGRIIGPFAQMGISADPSWA